MSLFGVNVFSGRLSNVSTKNVDEADLPFEHSKMKYLWTKEQNYLVQLKVLPTLCKYLIRTDELRKKFSSKFIFEIYCKMAFCWTRIL